MFYKIGCHLWHLAFMAGQYTEEQEIADGVRVMAAMTVFGPEMGGTPFSLPLESVQVALDHDNAAVQNFACKVLRQLR
ncbi:hypothetical protein ACFL26_02185 [Patescibacteria group bacterium]